MVSVPKIFCYIIQDLIMNLTKNEFLFHRNKFNPKKLHRERLRLYALRDEFVSRFTPEVIQSLDVEDYAIGKRSQDSFCYWLEYTLGGLGKIASPAKKFGVYYHNGEILAPAKYGSSWQEAFKNVKRSILELLDAGKKNDLPALRDNAFGPLVKGKILSTYYPDTFLNIYKKEHLQFFISTFGYNFENKDFLDLQRELIKIKNKDAVMKEWTLDEFSYFLYRVFPGTPTEDEIKILKKKKYVEESPIIEEVKAQEVLNTNDRIREIKENTLTVEARHQKIQNGVMQCLYREGYSDIKAEENHIDIKAKKNGFIHFFEIKTHDTAKECIREAIGQILEYNHYPKGCHASDMFIIGPCKLTSNDAEYIKYLRTFYKMKLYYRQYLEHANSLGPKQ